MRQLEQATITFNSLTHYIRTPTHTYVRFVSVGSEYSRHRQFDTNLGADVLLSCLLGIFTCTWIIIIQNCCWISIFNFFAICPLLYCFYSQFGVVVVSHLFDKFRMDVSIGVIIDWFIPKCVTLAASYWRYKIQILNTKFYLLENITLTFYENFLFLFYMVYVLIYVLWVV